LEHSLETIKKWQNGVITNTFWRRMQKQREIFLLSLKICWLSFHTKLQCDSGENAESPEVTNSPYYCQSTPTCASKDVRIQPASPMLTIQRRSNINCLKGGENRKLGCSVCERVRRFSHSWKCTVLIRKPLLSGRQILRLNQICH